MSNLETLKKEWDLLSSNSSFEIPSDRPVLRMAHKKTGICAYFDLKLDRFLSQREVALVMNGCAWMVEK